MAIKKPTVKRAIHKTPPKKKSPPKKNPLNGKMPELMKSKVDGMPIRTRPKKKDKNRKLRI